MVIKFFTVLTLFTLVSCSQKEDKLREIDQILPEKIYEGETITIYAIDDSIKINTDTLFFDIKFYMQDLSIRKGYVRLEDGKASITVPHGAAILLGGFYNMEGREKRDYVRRVYDNVTNKEVINAYQLWMDEQMMEKELTNYPNNLVTYVKYLEHSSEKVFLGQKSDTVLRQEISEYLKIIKQKANLEKADDMYALVSLYAFSQEYEASEDLLLSMMKKHPNSSFLDRAYSSYRVNSFLKRDDKEKTEIFSDNFDRYIAKNIPHTLIGIKNSLAPINMKYYSPKIIAKNAQFYLKNIDSTNLEYRKYFIRAKIKLDNKSILEAKHEALNILKEAKTEQWKIHSPMKIGGRNGFVETGSQIGFAYHLLAEVSEAAKYYNQAINYLDSAYLSYQTDRQNRFIKNPITDALNYKASIQRKINQSNEALKTYETLYQETKDDRVLDSIKVIFKEKEQEKGFESYAKNLKERVENKNQETKELAADFSIKDMSGYEIKLSEWKGRVVVLNFWANYCLPCAKEIPYLNKIWRETQTDDIIFLAVTKNTPLEVTRFAQRQKEMFSFSILPNAKELADVYDVNLVPTTIVINKKSEIIYQESGFSGNIDKLKQVVLEELNK